MTEPGSLTDPVRPAVAEGLGRPEDAESPGRAEEASLAELTKRLSEQVSRLAHEEIQLAKAEMTEKGKRAGLSAGMFGGAALLGLFALGVLTACVVVALDTVMPLWGATLLVAGLYALAAGALALAGRAEVRQATPVVPEQTKESVKEDVQWVKTQAKAGRQ
jgi:uncharacterized membrane protein YqjE